MYEEGEKKTRVHSPSCAESGSVSAPPIHFALHNQAYVPCKLGCARPIQHVCGTMGGGGGGGGGFGKKNSLREAKKKRSLWWTPPARREKPPPPPPPPPNRGKQKVLRSKSNQCMNVSQRREGGKCGPSQRRQTDELCGVSVSGVVEDWGGRGAGQKGSLFITALSCLLAQGIRQ